MTRVAFIVPCFNERDNIAPFYDQFEECFDQPGISYDWHLLFIDDGSSDGTWDALQQLVTSKAHVTAIQFSRNFGKEAAIWAGLNNVEADYIGIIDADLQQPPKDALAMCEILDNNANIDCVAAYQATRYEKGVMARVKKAFYDLFSKLSEMNTLANASDFRVFRACVANAILAMPESFRFSKGIFAWIGFVTQPYPYQPSDRHTGETTWSTTKLTKYAIEGILSFSVKPLRIATYLGFFAAACAIVYFLIVLIQTIVTGVDVPGYATLMSVVLLLGGTQLICMGIIGEYLSRTYIQSKNRPIFVERNRIDSEGKESNARS